MPSILVAPPTVDPLGLFNYLLNKELDEIVKGKDPHPDLKMFAYKNFYNSGDLPNKLLKHYMTAQGKDYILTIEEMKSLGVFVKITDEPRRQSAKKTR